MNEAFDKAERQAIRKAIALSTYNRDQLRLVEHDISDHDWLVATHKGLVAVHDGGATLITHGWFFGLCRIDDMLFLFENCALRDRSVPLGRIVQLRLMPHAIEFVGVLVKGLDANCHQLAIIDGLLCLVDTAHQVIRRYTLEGALVDVQAPFPIAAQSDESGEHLHLNSIASLSSGIALMLHNGRAVPAKCSELAWLTRDWRVRERIALPGHQCHDIVADDTGLLWHCASATGEIMASDGQRVKLSDDRMTRGLAFNAHGACVGLSSFGPRQNRDALPGAVVILDRAMHVRAIIELDGPPAVIIAI